MIKECREGDELKKEDRVWSGSKNLYEEIKESWRFDRKRWGGDEFIKDDR